MHPYSKRPPPADPLPLGTGDFEAVGYEAIPAAPRVPVFHRSMPQPQGFGFGQGRYPSHYSQVPAPPHSLSPVAMSSVRSAHATGPQRAQPTVVIRSRPSLKLGVSILVAGTLLGAVFGVGMRVRQNMAEAAFAAQLQEHDEEQQQQMAAAPPQAPIAPVVVDPTATPSTPPQAPAPLPPNAYAGVPFGSLVVAQPASHAAPAAAPAPAAPAAPPAPIAVPAVQKPAPQKHAAWWGKPAAGGAGGHPSLSAKVTPPAKADKDKDDGYKVASANNDEPAPKKAAKEPAAKPAKEPVAAKEEAKKPEPRASKSSSKASDDADKVLRAAMGATENTL